MIIIVNHLIIETKTPLCARNYRKVSFFFFLLFFVYNFFICEKSFNIFIKIYLFSAIKVLFNQCKMNDFRDVILERMKERNSRESSFQEIIINSELTFSIVFKDDFQCVLCSKCSYILRMRMNERENAIRRRVRNMELYKLSDDNYLV